MTHRSKSRWLAGAVIALAVTLPATAIAQSPRELFERARLLEENGRSLNRAVETYQQVIALAKSDRALAGAAQLRIALVKERQGKPEARAIFASVVREYADQRALVATAQARMAAAAGARAHSDVTPRRVLEGDWAGMGEISADGRFGVGIQRVGWSAFDIVLRDVSTGRTTVLVRGLNGRYGVQPRISPDGRYIAYSWAEEDLRSLRVIGTEGGSSPKEIIAPSKTSLMPVAWSPDGKALLVAMPFYDDSFREQMKSMDLSWVSLETRTVSTVKKFEGWQITLNPPIDARISPDGQYIAFSTIPAAGSSDRYLYVMNKNGQGETAVVASAGRRTTPMWTPDGTRLLFVDNSAGRRQLMTVRIHEGRAAGEPSVHYTDFTGDPLGMTTSGTFYYSRSIGGGNFEYIVSRTPAAGERPVVFQGLSASWSRDGRSVAFVRGETQGPELDLVIRDVASGQERSYRHAGITNVSPRWLPDGSGVILLIREPPGADSKRVFYMVDAQTGAFRRLFDRDSGGRVRTDTGAVSGDGKFLFLGARTNGSDAVTAIVAVDLSSGEERVIASLPAGTSSGGAMALTFRADGQTLAAAVFTKPWAVARLFTIAVDGSNYREVLESYGTGWISDAVRWTPDGRSILFLAHDANRNWRIMRIPADGGQPEFDGLSYETLAPLMPEHRMWPGNFNNIDVSADGTRIIASTLTFNKQEIWTLDGLLRVD